MESKNVLFIGKISNANRTAQIMHYFVAANYNCKWVLNFSSISQRKWDGIFQKLLEWPLVLFSVIIDIVAAVRSDLIVVPLKNYRYHKYAKLISKISSTPILIDSYYFLSLNILQGEKREFKNTKAFKYDKMMLSGDFHLMHPNLTELRVTEELVSQKILESKFSILPLSGGDLMPSYTKYRTEETLKLIWWASFSKMHGVEFVFSVFKEIQQSHPGLPISLLMVGTDETRSYIESLIEEYNVEKLVQLRTDLTMGDGSLVNEITSGYNIALGHFGDSLKSKSIISNKVVEAASFGLPTISLSNKALLEFFNHDELILVDSVTDCSDALISIMQGSVNLDNYACAIEKAYQREFSREQFDKTLSQIVGKVLEN